MSLPTTLATSSRRHKIMRGVRLMVEHIAEANSWQNRNFVHTIVRPVRHQFDQVKRPDVEMPACFINQPRERPVNYVGKHVEVWEMRYALVFWLKTPQEPDAWRNALLDDVEMVVDKYRHLRLNTSGDSGRGTLEAEPGSTAGLQQVDLHHVYDVAGDAGFLAPYQKIAVVMRCQYRHERGNPYST